MFIRNLMKKRFKESLIKIPCLMTVITFARKTFYPQRRIPFPGRNELLRRLGVMTPETILKVLDVLGKAHPSPSFVKIGANDGLTGDPCGDMFIRDIRWRGLLVEPVDYCVEKLKNTYCDQSRFTIVQAAIGHKRERRKFYFLAKEAKYSIPDMPEWYDQIGSFDREHIVRHLPIEANKFIIERDIDVFSLSSMLMQTGYVAPLFLHIDVEGFDYEVLKSLNFRQSRPSVIMIEHKHLSASDLYSMIELLEGNGYLSLDAGEDLVALTKTVAKTLNVIEVICSTD
jgi:FkbM family methyltransferase